MRYRQDESARLAKDMPAKDITLAKDETFTGGLCLVAADPKSNYIVLEQAAQGRDHDTWNTLMEKALAGLNCQVIQSTSDEAPGLLAYVEHHLGAHHSPDVFHVQHELVKAVCGPHGHQAAGGCQGGQHGARAARARTRATSGHGRCAGQARSRLPPEAAASLEQLEQDAQAANEEFERISAQREQVAQSIRHLGPGLPLCRLRERRAAKRSAHCGRYPRAD